MKRPWTVVVAALVASESSLLAAERSGEDVFAATCASCHGSDGRGASQAQTSLPLPPRDFTTCRRTMREADQDWSAVINGGGPARGFHRLMPAYGEVLSEGEQQAVLQYTRGFCPDPVWPRGDLNFPRAIVTEKPFVEDELVVSGGVATTSPRNVNGRLIYEKRFLRRQQLEVIVPFGSLQGPSGSHETGIGDVAAGAKSMLVANLDSGTVLSVAGEVILPTGNKDKGLGKGAVILEPFVSFAQGLPADCFVQVQTGAEIPVTESAGVEPEGFLRGALGTSFVQGRHGRMWSPIVEAVVTRELKSGVPMPLDLVPQFQVTLSRRQHVRASLGASVPTTNRAGRSTQVMAYVLWDWFDGLLLEGW